MKITYLDVDQIGVFDELSVEVMEVNESAERRPTWRYAR